MTITTVTTTAPSPANRAEIFRDTSLLREVHELEKTAGRNDPETSWEGRAVAREIMSEIAVEETRGRLQTFSKAREWRHLNWAITDTP